MGLETYTDLSGALCGTARYFKIVADPAMKRRKTRVYRIINLRQGLTIGSIHWYGQWRQYVFDPVEGAVWSVDCMEAVMLFIENLKARRADDA